MLDLNDELLIGVNSSAVLFGRFDKLVIGLLQLAALLLLKIIG